MRYIMFLAVLTVIDWFLKGFNLLVNIWLLRAIYRSGEVTKIYVFLLLYFLVAHDIAAGSIVFLHDIPSYFQDDSILADWPILYAICVIILCIQWWYHLLFLPVFSLMHFCALFLPTTFRRINMRFMWCAVGFLYLGTAIISAPLFTPYCGFVYHPYGKYWSSDDTKPYNSLYLAMSVWIQAFALVVMVSTNFAISAKLYVLRVKNKIKVQMTVHSVSRHPITGETQLAHVENQIQQRPKKKIFYIAPEVRLAASYLLLSFCFFASTLAYAFLLGTQNPLLKIVYIAAKNINSFKWIVYCLGNKKIRKFFMFNYAYGWSH